VRTTPRPVTSGHRLRQRKKVEEVTETDHDLRPEARNVGSDQSRGKRLRQGEAGAEVEAEARKGLIDPEAGLEAGKGRIDLEHGLEAGKSLDGLEVDLKGDRGAYQRAGPRRSPRSPGDPGHHHVLHTPSRMQGDPGQVRPHRTQESGRRRKGPDPRVRQRSQEENEVVLMFLFLII